MFLNNKFANSQSPIAQNDQQNQNASRPIEISQNCSSRRRMAQKMCRPPHSSIPPTLTFRRVQPFQFQNNFFLLAISFLIASSSLFVCQARAAASQISVDEDILRTLPSSMPKNIGEEEDGTVVELRLLDEQPDEEMEDKSEEGNGPIGEIKNVQQTESALRPIDEAIWWYFLANLGENSKQQKRHNFDRHENSMEAQNLVDSLFKAPSKKAPIRRCGTLLIKHIQTVCNGCLRSASDADPIIMSKRGNNNNPLKEARNRWKREAGFSKITDICCTQRACGDEELKPFCC